MKTILRVEELVQFLLCIYAFSLLPYAWWWFPVLLLLPDIGMIGYLINSKAGALSYNLFHTKIVGVLLFGIGLYTQENILILIGIILFAHAAMDRLLGYGLKYSDSFWHTHLGDL